MIYRFYDIVIESEDGDHRVDWEYAIDIPDCDMSTALGRQEHLATMFDSLVQASGCSIASFSCDPE